jgi:hypothetical protein
MRFVLVALLCAGCASSLSPTNEAELPEPRPVCCCDGSVSKDCGAPRSGCCSGHGGVCACR